MKTFLLLISMFISLSLIACSDHSHSTEHDDNKNHSKILIKEDQSKKLAEFHLNKLIKMKKINLSWLKSELKKSELKKLGTQKEWVVTFNNNKGVKGKHLYVFLSQTGQINGANFTGN